MMQMYVDSCSQDADARQWEPAFIALMDWHARLRVVVHEALLTLKPLRDPQRGLRLIADDTNVHDGNRPDQAS